MLQMVFQHLFESTELILKTNRESRFVTGPPLDSFPYRVLPRLLDLETRAKVTELRHHWNDSSWNTYYDHFHHYLSFHR